MYWNDSKKQENGSFDDERRKKEEKKHFISRDKLGVGTFTTYTSSGWCLLCMKCIHVCVYVIWLEWICIRFQVYMRRKCSTWAIHWTVKIVFFFLCVNLTEINKRLTFMVLESSLFFSFPLKNKAKSFPNERIIFTKSINLHKLKVVCSLMRSFRMYDVLVEIKSRRIRCEIIVCAVWVDLYLAIEQYFYLIMATIPGISKLVKKSTDVLA